MTTMARLTTILLLLLSSLWVAPAFSRPAERLYKWVDADGLVQYSNRLPPEAALQERKQISETGRVIKTYNAPQTPEEKAEAKRLAELEELRKDRERKRAIHDRSLLASYTSKADMISAQQNKITMVEALIQLTHSRIIAMNERLQKLTEEAAGYERSGKPLPFTLKQQISNLHDLIEHNTRFAADKEAEVNEISKLFARDITRYEELTSKQPATGKKQETPLEIAMHNPNVTLTREDRTLLATFSSESDLMFARDEELQTVDEGIKQAFSEVDALQKKLAELTDNANEYESSGKTLPDTLVRKIRETRDQIEKGEALLKARREEKQQIEARYNTSIERFRHLTASNP
jgi:Domain of unknown function (DUF4124)